MNCTSLPWALGHLSFWFCYPAHLLPLPILVASYILLWINFIPGKHLRDTGCKEVLELLIFENRMLTSFKYAIARRKWAENMTYNQNNAAKQLYGPLDLFCQASGVFRCQFKNPYAALLYWCYLLHSLFCIPLQGAWGNILPSKWLKWSLY